MKANVVRALVAAAVALSAVPPTPAAAADTGLAEHLAPLAPFVGKTWRGAVSAPDAAEPKFDVSRWERALNGQAVRILHSVNDGDYGGETLIIWDRKEERLAYYYFTTAGFYTTGTMRVENGKLVSREEVTGHPQGITVVEGTSELLPDGRLRVASRFLKAGEWVEGNAVLYEATPGAEVKFR